MYKANKKEWDEFSKGENVFIYDFMGAEKVPSLIKLGLFHGCAFKYPLAGTMIDDAIYDYFIAVPKEKLEEVYEMCKEENDDVAMSWCMAVLNTLGDDETLIIECD